MEANLKLLKKRRVAHTGSILPHMSCEEPKLLPDDFVYNIMKDMDKKKNVMSYQQLQEFKCQRRQDAPLDEDILGYQKSLHSKQAKKILPKKTFPLMKKCQTSLKHLKKNRCIPKPRAHVGSVPRPQCKPILNLEKNTTKFQHGSSSSTSKAKQSSSKSKSKISQSVFKTSNFKSCVSKQTINHIKEKAQVDQLSSSDDGDDAFEDFVQKANEIDSYSSDSDTDSRMIIRRKKSKTKLKQDNKKLRDLSENEVDRHFPKITSRPLSDSSECEEQEMCENVKNKKASFKKRKYSERESPIQLQEKVSDETTYNSLSEDPQDLDGLNYDSSDSESNLKVPNLNSTHIVDTSNINCDPNELYVRLVRDPEIDKLAMRFCSTHILKTSNMFYSSNDDCIVISGNSDNEEMQVEKLQVNPSVSSSWSCEDTDPGEFDVCEIPNQGLDSQSIESNLLHGSSSSRPTLSNTPKANVVAQIHNPDSINNVSNSKHHSIQMGLPASSKDSLSQQSLHTEADMDECVILCEKTQPDALDKISEIRDSSISGTNTNPNLFSQATNQLPSTDHNEDEMQDFNVKIVAVHSLTELQEPSASESNDVEVIDLSDDSHVPDIQENSNSVKKSIDVSESLKILDGNVSVMKDHESNLSLNCEADPKILEILSKIDFECIKEVISKTKVENSENNSCKIGDGSTCFNSFPPGISMPMPTCEKDIVSKDSNCTNRIEFQKQNSKNVTGQLHNSVSSDVNSKPSQIRNLNEISNELLDSQPVESQKNIALKCSTGDAVKDFHTSNQTSRKDLDKALLNDKNTNSLINVCPTEILAEDSHEILIKETESFKQINSINPSSLKNRTEPTGMLHIHAKKNSENVSDQFSEPFKNCSDAVPKDLNVPKIITNRAAEIQQDTCTDFKRTETTTSNMTVNNNKKASVPELADKQCKISKVRNEQIVQNRRMPQPAKKEIAIESPADELDGLAASYINDLNPLNKKVLPLLELYKKEYEKYKQIKNTESNVSAGLKLLHDNQVNKLKHIHASIKNLSKHSACFYKVSQEDCCSNVKTIVKNEIVDKVDVKKESENFQTSLSEKGVQVATKLESSGPTREKIFRLMKNIKCAHCGKQATARCQGCAEVYYCSSQCGEQSWRQGHYAVCKKS